MRASDAFRSALEDLASHKLRAGLTMLGMMFGVGAVIAMLAIGAGAERQALQLIDKLGVRNVVVRAKDFKPDELAEVRKKSLGLSPRDVDAIREAVPGAELVVPRLQIDVYKILSAGGKAEGKVYGISHLQSQLVRMRLEEGRFLDARDDETHAQTCVIGSSVRRDLFGAEIAVGRDVKINDVWCEVVGVLAPEASGGTTLQGVSVGSTAREIYLPITTATRKFDHDPLKSPLDEIVVRLAPGVSARQAESVITGLLDRLHGGVVDYETVVPEALLEQSRQTQRLFNIVMGAIAGISLLVGGIGIMNIMLASVLEQTREIGVRRAVGARRKDIRFQFLVNAFTLSLLGGVAGVLVGVAIARVVSSYAGWPTAVTLASIALSTGVSAAVGLVSGLYPALRAANLNPIDALRYE
ncbi:MAG TPA: ABC transporter permease [Polyangiaceae bacterium]|nr:ABC transporter permease [Polyangiaceae bacterium]